LSATTNYILQQHIINNAVKITKRETGWPQSRRKKFPEFFSIFHSHNYTFPEVIATKTLDGSI